MPTVEIEYLLDVLFIQEDSVDGDKSNIASNKDSGATATNATEDLDVISPEGEDPRGSSHVLEVMTEDGNDGQKGQHEQSAQYHWLRTSSR